MNARDIRRKLNEYFGAVKHCVTIMRSGNRMLVDVEYEDFRSEPVVQTEVRQIIGTECFLNVKRECSENLSAEIRRFMENDKDGQLTLRMLMCYYTL